MKRYLALAAALAAWALLYAYSRPISAPLGDRVRLEEMTWVEVRQAIADGMTTVIVPTGGVEQNGPHMVLGKHNYIVRYTAERIARALGDALVAPVVAYVPEGDVDPPTGHMAFAGTISVPEQVFEAVLEATARSLRTHGFRIIAFVGDSGGNQAAQAAVAERLNAEWRGSETRVIHVDDYYAANGQVQWLTSQGETLDAIGTHAGIRDTSELLAVFPEGIRSEMVKPDGGHYLEDTGVDGDPTRGSSERGETLLHLKIDAAVRQIRTARR